MHTSAQSIDENTIAKTLSIAREEMARWWRWWKIKSVLISRAQRRWFVEWCKYHTLPKTHTKLHFLLPFCCLNCWTMCCSWFVHLKPSWIASRWNWLRSYTESELRHWNWKCWSVPTTKCQYAERLWNFECLNFVTQHFTCVRRIGISCNESARCSTQWKLKVGRSAVPHAKIHAI